MDTVKWHPSVIGNPATGTSRIADISKSGRDADSADQDLIDSSIRSAGVTSLPEKTQSRTSSGYAVFDFDGTLSDGCISMAFMDRLHEADLYNPQIYQQQMDVLAEYKAGQISYDDWVDQWGKLWGEGLKGQQAATVQTEAAAFFEAYKDKIFPQSRELVDLTTRENLRPMILSAGVQEVVQLAGQHLGVDSVLATQAQVKDGLYTGALLTDVHTPTGKGRVMRDLVDRQGPPAFAFGDSSGDEEMLAIAINPVALNPNDELANVARERGWTVQSSNDVVDAVDRHPGMALVRRVADPGHGRPLPVIRFWSGYKSDEITDDQFLRALQKVLIPDTTKVGGDGGLVGYTPVVIKGGGAKLPDEIALVAYYDRGYYDAIRATPEGARYGRNHSRLEGVQDIPGAEDLEGKPLFVPRSDPERGSYSATPLPYDGTVEVGNAYTSSPDPHFNWVTGDVLVRVYEREGSAGDARYANATKAHIEATKNATGVTGHLVRIEDGYLLEYLFFEDREARDTYTKAGGNPLRGVAKVHQTTPLTDLADAEAQTHEFPIARDQGYQLEFTPDVEGLHRGPEVVTDSDGFPVGYPAGMPRLKVDTRFEGTMPVIEFTARTQQGYAFGHGEPRVNGSTIEVEIGTAPEATFGIDIPNRTETKRLTLPELNEKFGPWTVVLRNTDGDVMARLPLSRDPGQLSLLPSMYTEELQ